MSRLTSRPLTISPPNISPLRIAVLGNSHVAALQHGLAEGWPGADITFFAAEGTRLTDLAVEGDALVPTTPRLRAALARSSGGLEAIDAAAYDAFVVYGLRFFVRPLAPGLSSAVQHAALADRFDLSAAATVLRAVRKVSSAPIVVAPTPLEAPAPQDRPPASALGYEAMIGWTSAHVETAFSDVIVVGQPGETRVSDVFTDPRFAVDAPRLDDGRRSGARTYNARDRHHMNGAFGTAMFNAFADNIGLIKHTGSVGSGTTKTFAAAQ